MLVKYCCHVDESRGKSLKISVCKKVINSLQMENSMKRVRLKNGIKKRSVNEKDYKISVWQQFLKSRKKLYNKYRGMQQFLKLRQFPYNNNERFS